MDEGTEDIKDEDSYEIKGEDGLTLWCKGSFYKDMVTHPEVIKAYKDSLK